MATNRQIWTKAAAYLPAMMREPPKPSVAVWDCIAGQMRAFGLDPNELMVPRPDGD